MHAADTVGSAAAIAWWIWPIALFAATFALGIIAVLAGIGGGVLFVPIVGSFFPFHLDFVRGAGLLLALSGALAAAPRLLRTGLASLRLAMPLALVGLGRLDRRRAGRPRRCRAALEARSAADLVIAARCLAIAALAGTRQRSAHPRWRRPLARARRSRLRAWIRAAGERASTGSTHRHAARRARAFAGDRLRRRDSSAWAPAGPTCRR